MKKHLSILLFTISLAFLSSCVTQKAELTPRVFTYFDARDKTMAVPPKPSGFCAEFKNCMRERGWKIKTSGLSDQLAERGSYSSSPARYSLLLREKVREGYNESNYEPKEQPSALTKACVAIITLPIQPFSILYHRLNGTRKDPDKKFDIRIVRQTGLEEVSATIIDNRTGDEVMTFFAREVIPKLDAKTFADTIAENTK